MQRLSALAIAYGQGPSWSHPLFIGHHHPQAIVIAVIAPCADADDVGQRATSWELRAAQGKPQAAYDLLVPLYGWFTEGFDTADLQEAKTLLSACA